MTPAGRGAVLIYTVAAVRVPESNSNRVARRSTFGAVLRMPDVANFAIGAVLLACVSGCGAADSAGSAASTRLRHRRLGKRSGLRLRYPSAGIGQGRGTTPPDDWKTEQFLGPIVEAVKLTGTRHPGRGTVRTRPYCVKKYSLLF